MNVRFDKFEEAVLGRDLEEQKMYINKDNIKDDYPTFVIRTGKNIILLGGCHEVYVEHISNFENKRYLPIHYNVTLS